VTVIAVGTVKGAVGATTTALALAAALAEHEPVTLVEADPSGGSLVGTSPALASAPTLESMMMQRRDRIEADDLLAIAQPLGDLLVAALPPDPFKAHLVVGQPRSPWVPGLRLLEGFVVCDVGRVHPGSPAWAVLELADTVFVVSPADPMAMAAAVEWADQRGRVGPGVDGLEGAAIRLVLTEAAARGTGRSARSDGETAVYVAGDLPWDPPGVHVLLRGASLRHRSMRRSRLAASARALAATVVSPAEAA
jgi:hypothetical protein